MSTADLLHRRASSILLYRIHICKGNTELNRTKEWSTNIPPLLTCKAVNSTAVGSLIEHNFQCCTYRSLPLPHILSIPGGRNNLRMPFDKDKRRRVPYFFWNGVLTQVENLNRDNFFFLLYVKPASIMRLFVKHQNFKLSFFWCTFVMKVMMNWPTSDIVKDLWQNSTSIWKSLIPVNRHVVWCFLRISAQKSAIMPYL